MIYRAWRANDGEGQVFPPPYDEGNFYRPIASRPGGLSYRGEFETRRALLRKEIKTVF